VFDTVAKLLEQNPDLGHSATKRATDIALTNGTTITAIPSDYKGAAGSRHSLAVFDELWGFTLERAERLFEELTPPPTEPDAWVLIVTTAGWTGESVLLERLYRQGLAGERIDDELELYRADELCMFWSQMPRQPWQTERYYAEQRRHLRPNTYARLHENKWVTAESTFITPEWWDGCVDPALRPLLPTQEHPVFVGVDASTKHDTAAVVGLIRKDERLILATHRIWTPSADRPLDLEATIEAYLRDLHQHYDVQQILCDPYQLHRSITTLKAAGLRIEEFPQTTANTTRMGQVLFDLLKGRTLRLYPDDEMRRQALNTVAIETPRGFRIAKERASRKIDCIAALSMACCAMLDATGRVLSLRDLLFDKDLVAMGEANPDDQMVEVNGQRLDPDLAGQFGAGRTAGGGWRPAGFSP
jgi:phage terminase large subunit-like protein